MSFDSVGLQYLSLQCVLVVLRAPVRTDVTDVERKDEKEFPDHPRIKWSFKNNNSKQGPRGGRAEKRDDGRMLSVARSTRLST